MSRLSDAALKQTADIITELLKQGYGLDNGNPIVPPLAKALNLSRSAAQARIETVKRRADVDWSLEQDEALPDAEIPTGEVTRLQREIASWRQKFYQSQQQLSEAQHSRSLIQKLQEQRPHNKEWEWRGKGDGSHPGIPVLFISDMQYGEYISAKELDGLNEYNPQIAEERYHRLIDKACHIAFDCMPNPDYPGIILLRGGDLISGDIHQELSETQSQTSMEQIWALADIESTGIAKLGKEFKKVEIISVPGNHGRTTIKPRAKKYYATNLETTLAYMLEREFKQEKYWWWTPESGDAYFNVYGHNILLTHGDRIGSRGGTGFVGVAATILRGMKKTRDQYASMSKPLDTILCGHFHEYMELPYGFCNGTMAGFNEYAMSLRIAPRPPMQLLFFIHPKHGITYRIPIHLDDDPVANAASWAPSQNQKRS